MTVQLKYSMGYKIFFTFAYSTVANAHGDKNILCVDWSHESEILSGGADNKTNSHVIEKTV